MPGLQGEPGLPGVDVRRSQSVTFTLLFHTSLMAVGSFDDSRFTSRLPFREVQGTRAIQGLRADQEWRYVYGTCCHI